MGTGEKTKEHIVEQAAGLFNRKGFAGTSMSDLMDATGLQKGGIYRHFDSKEELATITTATMEGTIMMTQLYDDPGYVHAAASRPKRR